MKMERFRRFRGDRRGIALLAAAPVLVTLGGLVIATLLITLLPQIASWLASSLRIDVLTVHVPLFVNPGNALMQGADPGAGEFAGISSAMGNLYSMFQLLALVGFVIAFIFVGLSYVSEQFRLVSEGTAHRMISESVMFIILILIFPLVYNLGASALNAVNEGMILKDPSDPSVTVKQIVEKVIGAASAPALAGGVLEEAVVGWLLRFVFFTITLISVFSAAIMGFFRFFGTAVLATILPLALIFTLIPLTRRVGEALTDSLLGFMLVTILVSTFFRFAYEVIKPNPPGLVAWLTGLGTLLIVGMVPTVLAPLFGGVFRHAGLAITGAIAAPIAGLASQAFALPAGTVGGTLGAAAHIAPEGVSRARLLWEGAKAGAMGALGSTSMMGSFARGLFGVGKTAADSYVSEKLTEGVGIGELGELQGNFRRHIESFQANLKSVNNWKTNPTGRQQLIKDGESLIQMYGEDFRNLPREEAANFLYATKYGRSLNLQDKKDRRVLEHFIKGLDARSKDWLSETRQALKLAYEDAKARLGTIDAKAYMRALYETGGHKIDTYEPKERLMPE